MVVSILQIVYLLVPTKLT
uniref:Uncharacterized protein n=1 Tax=Arundo donax TaxID=35708 RepID=A0A0A9BBI3_ARUDO